MISREAFVEMMVAIISGAADDKIPLGGAAHLLYALAQPEVIETRIDITDQITAQLLDWNEYNKGQLLAVEVIQLTFPCSTLGVHEGDEEEHARGCDKGKHVCQMTRVSGAPGWSPSHVSSEFDFDEIVVNISTPLHPDYDPDGMGVTASASNRGLESAFRRMFGGSKIEAEVADFRAELDRLFPSAPPNPRKEGTE